jgi:hypothetical protein
MTSTLSRVLFLWVALIILIQPLWSHLDYLLDVVVKSNAEYAAQKAAPYGSITPEISQEVLAHLTAVGFDPAQVLIESENGVQPRGGAIDVKIRAPRLPQFFYRFGQANFPEQYYAHAYTTSEWIP